MSNTFTTNHPLRKIYNRNTLKISYSCMANMASIISSNNKQKLTPPAEEQQKKCNCRNKSQCPLNGNCLEKCVIYQATVRTTNSAETYIGLTEQEFKTRFRNHSTSFNHQRYRNSTELSKYIWTLKDKNTNYILEWKLITKAAAYSPSTKRCNLCLTEKYFIIYKSYMCSLNKRNELASSCRHTNKFLLCNFKS